MISFAAFKFYFPHGGFILTANRGLLLISSPKIQPTAHKSTPSSYFLAPYNSSGARYHLLTGYEGVMNISPVKEQSCLCGYNVLLLRKVNDGDRALDSNSFYFS